ncbi:hypothetical protein [uncultured Pseudoteredinibacter sp.]|uniref:hypothetical protein n=1 Tax=uncultured Pseudoteredinibacter sp. TaxID=1641701 RepID=UPI002621B673|nr:hypothetical protein [uncultured Pseudoteredinibacter sp.]
MKPVFLAFLYSLLLLLLGALNSAYVFASAAQEQPLAFVRIALLDEPEEALLGQERLLSVKLYSKTWLRKAPRYPEIEIDGALTVRPLSFANHSQELLDGAEYIVQEQQYRIYPQRLGAFYIPPVVLNLSISLEGEEHRLSLHSDDLIFTVKESVPAIVARNLQLEESYQLLRQGESIDLAEGQEWELQLGDILLRSLSLRAEKISAVLLPNLYLLNSRSDSLLGRGEERQFSQQSNELGALYTEVSRLEDLENRGEVSAIREEIWRYELSFAGQLEIPAIALSYWDSEQAEYRYRELDAKTIHIGPTTPWWLLATLLFVLSILVLFYYSSSVQLILKKLKRPHLESSEKSVFDELVYALDHHAAQRAACLLALWLKYYDAEPEVLEPYIQLKECLSMPYELQAAAAEDNEGPEQIKIEKIKTEKIKEELRSLRSVLQGHKKKQKPEKNICLPPLNPYSKN